MKEKETKDREVAIDRQFNQMSVDDDVAIDVAIDGIDMQLAYEMVVILKQQKNDLLSTSPL